MKRNAVVFDLDWTLCQSYPNRPYSYSSEEIVNFAIYDELMKEWYQLWVDIIILTWRKHNEHYKSTVDWLDNNEIPYDHLIMCKDWQPEENHIFKKRVLRVLSQMYEQICMVYDDNPAVWEVCKKLWIPFYPVY